MNINLLDLNQTRLDLEAAVAGCVLFDRGQNILAVDIATDDFVSAPVRAIIGSARESTPIDPVIAKAWASKNNSNVSVVQISDLINAVPTSHNFFYYLSQLKTVIYKSKIEELRHEVRNRAENEDLLVLSKEIAEKESILASRYLETDHDGSLSDACAELLYKIEVGQDNDELIATNWDIFDDLHAGGLLPNEMIVIAARPSIGKTAAALQIAADADCKVAFFSLEMNKTKLSTRLLAGAAKQNTRIASRQPSQISHEVRNKLLSASDRLMQLAEKILVFDEHDQTIDSIRRRARKAVADGAGMIIIDYLQLISCIGDTRQEAIAGVSRSIKGMAKELNVPVIVLSQLGRACESEKRAPRLSDLRESGAIEQDADSVIFLHDSGSKTENGYKKCFVIAGKGRDIGVGFRDAIFNQDHQRFYRLSNQEEL